jgi:hypothetical protein
LFEKVKKLISKKKQVQLNMKKAEKVTPKIKEYLEKYEERKSKGGENKIKVLSADMNYEAK